MDSILIGNFSKAKKLRFAPVDLVGGKKIAASRVACLHTLTNTTADGQVPFPTFCTIHAESHFLSFLNPHTIKFHGIPNSASLGIVYCRKCLRGVYSWIILAHSDRVKIRYHIMYAALHKFEKHARHSCIGILRGTWIFQLKATYAFCVALQDCRQSSKMNCRTRI